MTRQKRLINVLAIAVLVTGTISLSTTTAQATTKYSDRYFADASGNPTFMLGYYAWDLPRATVMIDTAATYHLNYIRMTVGFCGYGPPYAFSYNYSTGKTDMDSWDSSYWTSVSDAVSYAASKGINVHMAIFDAASLRYDGSDDIYLDCYWNPANQVVAEYSDPDANGDGNIDEDGEFYNLSAFDDDTGIGFYQRKLIDKTISELDGYSNIFYEVGNELTGASATWFNHVISYIKGQTSKAVTISDATFHGDSSVAYDAGNSDGYSEHFQRYPSDSKRNAEYYVGRGLPFLNDPDGYGYNQSPEDSRQAAWYSFVGGAAGWGGFSIDWFDGGSANTTRATYYQYLADFISGTGIPFWNMDPHQDWISEHPCEASPSQPPWWRRGRCSYNSLLAQDSQFYLAYVLNDPTVTITVADGRYYYRTYDPQTGTYGSPQVFTGGTRLIVNKPAGASDWVAYVYPYQ